MTDGKRTKTETRNAARDELMQSMATAWNRTSDLLDEGPERDELEAEMDRQMRRVERLFGYELGSWSRGV